MYTERQDDMYGGRVPINKAEREDGCLVDDPFFDWQPTKRFKLEDGLACFAHQNV